jgi:hypothetical protein
MASVEVESVDYFRQLTEKELHDVASQRIFGGFIIHGYIMGISWVYRGKCGFEEDDLARKTVTHKNQRGICGYGIPQGHTHTPSKNCIFFGGREEWSAMKAYTEVTVFSHIIT